MLPDRVYVCVWLYGNVCQNWVLSHAVSDAYLSFSEEASDGGVVELSSGGRARAVTDSNKFEYAELLMDYKLAREYEAPLQVRRATLTRCRTVPHVD